MGTTRWSGMTRWTMTAMLRSTSSPPLKAAIGVWRSSGSTSMTIPRGGRPLVMANRMSARAAGHGVDRLVGEDLVLGYQGAIHVGQHQADLGRRHGAPSHVVPSVSDWARVTMASIATLVYRCRRSRST